MLTKQEQVLSLLDQYIHAHGLQILESKDIDHGRQLKLTDGTEKCTFNVYHTGKVVIGGKQSQLRQQLQEWANFQAAEMAQDATTTDDSTAPAATQNHGTRYIVSAEKWDKIRVAVGELEAQVEFSEHDTGHEVYRADVRADGDRIVVTQYRSGVLFVQGRSSEIFHRVCGLLDSMLAQSPADHATRYVTEKQAGHLRSQMDRPEAEEKAWQFLERELDEAILAFLPEHDRKTLIAGAMLLEAAQELAMPDYAPLVMPFARAYEGYLIKLFSAIGLADQKKIEKSDIGAIQVGGWLDQLPNWLKFPKRDGHLVHDLKTAWEGTRHVTMHSDPNRQMAFPNYDKAKNEICGVLMRAMTRSYDGLVLGEVPLVDPEQVKVTASKNVSAKDESQKKKLVIDDDQELLRRLKELGYEIETFRNIKDSPKWRVRTESWNLVCPRKPGNTLVVSGEKIDDFLAWYHASDEVKISSWDSANTDTIVPHIGADEAGKGDYYGPLVTAAVYVDATTEVELIRLGVRDSKAISDNVVLDLAEKIRSRCLHAIELLPPADYNQEYRKQPNMNVILAALHARAIRKAAQLSGAQEVLVDQFASAEVLENALSVSDGTIRLVQRPQAESDIAVAAASILARAAFVEAIYDLRAKSGMEIRVPPIFDSVGEVFLTRRLVGSAILVGKLNQLGGTNVGTQSESRHSGGNTSGSAGGLSQGECADDVKG